MCAECDKFEASPKAPCELSYQQTRERKSFHNQKEVSSFNMLDSKQLVTKIIFMARKRQCDKLLASYRRDTFDNGERVPPIPFQTSHEEKGSLYISQERLVVWIWRDDFNKFWTFELWNIFSSNSKHECLFCILGASLELVLCPSIFIHLFYVLFSLSLLFSMSHDTCVHVH